MEILDVKNLTFTYPNGDSPVLNNISFQIQAGDFVVLCGSTGSGKSTLLKMLKKELTPLGKREGQVFIQGNELKFDEEEKKSEKNSNGFVGFVMQNLKEQIVTDKVWHELAFGLENINMSQEKMALRVAEMASYFGIEGWYERNVNELSGGQMQLLNLASVMVMDPVILLLDEPSAQLDPIAASEFFQTLYKLNRDFALTVVIAEHRLEELIPICDKLMLMKNGSLSGFGKTGEVLNKIEPDEEIFEALPSAYRLFRKLDDRKSGYPVSIRDGRDYLRHYLEEAEKSGIPQVNSEEKTEKESKVPALEFKDVFLRFSKDSNDVLAGMDLKVYSGEIFCILGGNGSGKTTALNVAAGLLRPYSGTVKVFGKKIKEYKNQSLYNKCLSMLPQDVQTVFLHNTVFEELGLQKKDIDAFEEDDFPYDLKPLFYKHPYDLSGGEQQILALAKAYMTEPKLLLLDEPTKGLDAYRKLQFAEMLKKLKSKGITCIIVTHDVELAAKCADRCALFFRGKAVACSKTDEFFINNNFYTTSTVCITKNLCGPYVTVEDAVERLK